MERKYTSELEKRNRKNTVMVGLQMGTFGKCRNRTILYTANAQPRAI